MTLILAAALFQSSFAQTSPQRAQEGVLMLKHGTTLSGFITPAGDRYIVLLGDSGEARVPTADVVAVVSNMQAAYEFKRSRLGDGLAARIELAQWCLQYEMPARAADQLLAAERHFGRQPQLESLHQRILASTMARTDAGNPTERDTAVAKVSFEEVLSNLPSNTIDSFNSTVQPLLQNRCASGGCHNTRGTSEYILFRPFVGQSTTRRLTERNLQATLAYVDRTSPLESILLAKAGVAHGGAATAAIDEREQRQLELLAEWLRSLGAQPRQYEPPTIAPTNVLLYQSGRLPAVGPEASPVEARPRKPKEIAPPIGDPFDPARFNQQHHGRSQ